MSVLLVVGYVGDQKMGSSAAFGISINEAIRKRNEYERKLEKRLKKFFENQNRKRSAEIRKTKLRKQREAEREAERERTEMERKKKYI